MDDRPFPPFTYVPGKTPRPADSPVHQASPAIDFSRWPASPQFQEGLRLYLHGFYWEAHEAWEWVWLQLGRKGPQADFIKGLIKLAAAGVKVLEGNDNGARRHLNRAHELLTAVSDTVLSLPWLDVLNRLGDACPEMPQGFDPSSPAPIDGFTPDLPPGWPDRSEH